MQWLVLIEAERGADREGVDAGPFRKLLAALADPAPGALYSLDRYALQIEVEAPGASEAVRAAIQRWEGGLRETGLPRWELIRVEALTQDEFERDFLTPEAEVVGDRAWSSPSPPAGSDADHERGFEELLLRHAFHDPLTDVASQSLFRDHVEHALGRPRASRERCALLLLDVDRFAELNQQLGPRTADAVLVTIAQRVSRAAGPRHTVGRLGGDQFAILLQAVSNDEACTTARRVVESVAAPVVVNATEVHVTVSVGIALEEQGDTGDDLLSRASLAVRTAQDRGGGRYEVFCLEMVDADVRRLRAERETMTAPDTNSYLALLERVSLAVAQCSTLEKAGLAVLGQICDHVGFPVGRLYVLDSGQAADPLPAGIWMAGTPERFGTFREAAARHPLRRGEGVAGQALASSAAVCVRDIADEPALAVPHETVAAGLRGALAVPVVAGGTPLAVLEFFAEQALEDCDGLLQLLTAVGAHLAAVARLAAAETASANADARLRVLLENSGIHVKILGPEGRLREQYPANWPEDSTLPLSAVDFVHPDDVVVAIRGWAEALGSPGARPPIELRTRAEDGSWRWVQVTIHNMLDEPGVGGIVTYAWDIEARKQSEEARRQSEARLREAQALARLGTWHADLVTGAVEWSDELYRILGLQPGEVTASHASLLELAHPDDRPALEELRHLLRSGAGQPYQFRVPRPDGTVRWISGQALAVCDSAGRPVAVQGTAHDVTRRKELEQTLHEAEQRLQAVEALAGVGSWRADAMTGCTVWSPELYHLLGLNPAQIKAGAETFLASVHPEDRHAAEVQALCQRGLAAATAFECRIVRPGGDIRMVRVRSSPARDGAGAVVAYHGVVCEATPARNDETVPA